MVAIRRFFLGDVPTLVRRAWEDAAPELERYLKKLHASETAGVSSGFNNVTPTTVGPDNVADPGDENSGWAAANHTHDFRSDELYAFAFMGH